MHSRSEVDQVLALVADGMNDSQTSRVTGINRTTIREWRRLGPPGRRQGHRGPSRCPRCDCVPVDEPGYAYLLGLYLGDGCISREPRAYRLRIVQDVRYPHLNSLITLAVSRVRPGAVGSISRVGCVEIYAYWQHWPCLLPQHGPGRKHQRPIILARWQEEIVSRYPRQLLRGLIHSDGCRVMNRVWSGNEYPRYFFTNSSPDILRIFRQACDTIGVQYRQSKPTVVSIARRPDVAILDSFIGPKA